MTLQQAIEFIESSLNKNLERMRHPGLLDTLEVCLLSGKVQEAQKVLGWLKTVRKL